LTSKLLAPLLLMRHEQLTPTQELEQQLSRVRGAVTTEAGRLERHFTRAQEAGQQRNTDAADALRKVRAEGVLYMRFGRGALPVRLCACRPLAFCLIVGSCHQ